MRINEDYELLIDSIGTFILRNHYKSEKTGTMQYKDIGYYPNIEQALSGCLRHGMIQTELRGVKEVVDELRRIEVDIKKMLKKIC